MLSANNYYDYLNKRCIIDSHGNRYRGKFDSLSGVIVRPGASSIGVKVDGYTNEASGYGVYWFKRDELTIVTHADIEKSRLDAIVACGGGAGCFTPRGTNVGGMDCFPTMEASIGEVIIVGAGGTLSDVICAGGGGGNNADIVYSTKYDFFPTQNKQFKNEMEELEMTMKLVELAKERDLKAVNDSKAYQTNVLLDTDDVVIALENKRADEGKTPLGHVQKVGIVTKETDEAIKVIQEKAAKECHEIEKKYEELYAALELPEVNAIMVLKAAGILNADGTGLA